MGEVLSDLGSVKLPGVSDEYVLAMSQAAGDEVFGFVDVFVDPAFLVEEGGVYRDPVMGERLFVDVVVEELGRKKLGRRLGLEGRRVRLVMAGGERWARLLVDELGMRVSFYVGEVGPVRVGTERRVLTPATVFNPGGVLARSGRGLDSWRLLFGGWSRERLVKEFHSTGWWAKFFRPLVMGLVLATGVAGAVFGNAAGFNGIFLSYVNINRAVFGREDRARQLLAAIVNSRAGDKVMPGVVGRGGRVMTIRDFIEAARARGHGDKNIWLAVGSRLVGLESNRDVLAELVKLQRASGSKVLIPVPSDAEANQTSVDTANKALAASSLRLEKQKAVNDRLEKENETKKLDWLAAVDRADGRLDRASEGVEDAQAALVLKRRVAGIRAGVIQVDAVDRWAKWIERLNCQGTRKWPTSVGGLLVPMCPPQGEGGIPDRFYSPSEALAAMREQFDKFGGQDAGLPGFTDAEILERVRVFQLENPQLGPGRSVMRGPVSSVSTPGSMVRPGGGYSTSAAEWAWGLAAIGGVFGRRRLARLLFGPKPGNQAPLPIDDLGEADGLADDELRNFIGDMEQEYKTPGLAVFQFVATLSGVGFAIGAIMGGLQALEIELESKDMDAAVTLSQIAADPKNHLKEAVVPDGSGLRVPDWIIKNVREEEAVSSMDPFAELKDGPLFRVLSKLQALDAEFYTDITKWSDPTYVRTQREDITKRQTDVNKKLDKQADRSVTIGKTASSFRTYEQKIIQIDEEVTALEKLKKTITDQGVTIDNQNANIEQNLSDSARDTAWNTAFESWFGRKPGGPTITINGQEIFVPTSRRNTSYEPTGEQAAREFIAFYETQTIRHTAFDNLTPNQTQNLDWLKDLVKTAVDTHWNKLGRQPRTDPLDPTSPNY
ncbi:MAG: hypothetical protein ACRCYQ_17350, partial [Nocardioides sp.]